MKSLYHSCFSSHDEVLFRDDEDYRVFVNSMALSLFKTDTGLLADSVMSDHVHLIPEAENLGSFLKSLKSRYSIHFEQKYGRNNLLRDKSCYTVKLDGIMHILAAISYVYRNGLHHGLCSTAFEYQQSSVNCIYKKELGKILTPSLITSKSEIRSYLPKHSEFPDTYHMDESGMLLRESFIQIEQVEHLYRTPKSFQYYMGRLSNEEWKREQQNDENGISPITLDKIEFCKDESMISKMMKNENGRINKSRLDDKAVCQIIDKKFVPKYGKRSVYFISEDAKKRIADALYYDYHCSSGQIKRCLIL